MVWQRYQSVPFVVSGCIFIKTARTAHKRPDKPIDRVSFSGLSACSEMDLTGILTRNTDFKSPSMVIWEERIVQGFVWQFFKAVHSTSTYSPGTMAAQQSGKWQHLSTLDILHNVDSLYYSTYNNNITCTHFVFYAVNVYILVYLHYPVSVSILDSFFLHAFV